MRSLWSEDNLFAWLIVVNQLLTGKPFDLHCHSNLTRAVLPYHLTEFDVHDVLNVVCSSPPMQVNPKFQCTGLNENDQYYMKTCPAKVGDYFEFFAEIGINILQLSLADFRSAGGSVDMSGGELGIAALGTQ